MYIDDLVKSYADWIKDEISVTKFNEYFQITTPFLDHTNDYFQLYVKFNSDGTITITDDGYTINNLYMSGVDIRRSPARRLRLEKTIHAFGVDIDDDYTIISHATIENFAQTKHLFVQALMKVDDMFALSQNSVKDYFNDDVKLFFDSNNIYYSENLSLIGKSGGVHPYDFHFQRSKTLPERFCRTINKINSANRTSAIFSWIDTEPSRDPTAKFIVLINDTQLVKPEHITAFRNYDIQTVLFSEIDKNKEKFCA